MSASRRAAGSRLPARSGALGLALALAFAPWAARGAGPEGEKPAAPPAAPAPPSAPPARPGPGAVISEVAPFGLGSLRKNEPISIRSDELEAMAAQGRRQLDFKGHVEVIQADLALRSQRLRAFYEGGESQPRRLVAEGGVHVRQGESEAFCDEATYEVKTEKIFCRGSARVVDAKQNSMAGQTIEFDLANERVRVTGGAHLVLHPEAKPPADAPAAPAAPAEES